MNGSIQPTVELATTNGNGFAYPYPVMYGNNGGFGNGFGGDALWLIVLLALFGGWGNGNGFGGGYNNDFAWLSNGQKDIMTNTNNGFDTLHLSNQLEGNRDAINGLSNQICNSTASVNSALTNGFYNAEISANNRAVNQMQDTFALSRQFADCCCDNKLAVQDLKATVISENCSDREVLRQIGQDILVNQTANTQKIIDEIFRDRLDEKDDKIAELNRQLQMADLRASQIAQTQAITSNIYNELKNCPVGTVPVYGSQPIFTCPNNNGCGCGFNTTSQFI
jgi:hypothetical protein